MQDAISGKRSLEIDTLASGVAKRKIITRFTADMDTVYEVFFKARNLAGDGYVTVSVRGDLEKPDVEYVGAVAPVLLQGRHPAGADGD